MRQYFQFKTLDLVAPWLLFVAVVWFCWKLAALIWLVLAPPQVPAARDVSLQSGQGVAVPNITNVSLFKEKRIAVTAQRQANASLKLEGVFMGYPARQSAAVIRVNNKPNRYRVDEEIEGSSQRLSAVFWDHVELRDSSGQASTLYFNDKAPSTSQQSKSSLRTRPALSETQQVQNALGDAMRQLKQNPMTYLNQMGVKPTSQGYEVTGTANAELRQRMGLRPGDKIVSLNGRPLGQVQNDVRLLEQVRQQRSAQIEIRRGEQTMTIQQSF